MFNPKFLRFFAVPALAVTLLAGCDRVKSDNPLSPTIAGPIAGVTITAPRAIEPAAGQTVKDAEQPLRIVIENAQTNGVRPVTMSFEIAADADFRTIVFSQNGLAPSATGTTRVILPERLQAGRFYFWRTRALDGANSSEWSPSIRFEVQVNIIIGTPTPVSPTTSTRIASLSPELRVKNGTSSGPHGPLSYQFQISTNDTITAVVGEGWSSESGSGETVYVGPRLPNYDETYYWRGRISDGTNTGPWSRTEVFRSPLLPVVPVIPVIPTPGVPTGNWQVCSALTGDKQRLVECVHAAIQPGRSEHLAFEVTKRVAWLLRGEGAGLLIKTGGENIIAWMGYSFSLSRVCYPDGHIFKVLTDAGEGGTNGPTWSDNDFVERRFYVPAIDPGG
jgi:hypothetical protein